MAEQLEEQPVAEQEPVAPVADTQPTQPQPAPYIDRVYSALKDNLSGFNKTPEQFKEAMKDSTYAAKAYGALKDNLAGFNKTPDQFYQEVGVAKKAQPSGGLNTLPSSSNGSSPFLSSPQPTELTPVLPQYREQVKERQQQQAQQLSDQLKSLRNSMDDQHKADFDKALQMSTDQGQLAPVTKEEQDHYNYMQTPLGKTLGSVAYLGSQATHGTLQIAKGLAHVASLANNPAAAMSGTDNIDKAFEGADKFADMGLTKGDIARIETGNTLGNHILSTAGQLANFAPAIAGGEVGETGGVLPKALFYLQGVGAGKEAADKIPGLNPVAKEALIQGTGAVNLALTDLGGNLFNKGVSNSLKDKVVTGIAADAIKEAAGKSVSEDGFKNLIDGQVKSFVDKFQRAPQEALSHYVDAAKTFTKLDVGNFAVHKAVDALQSANGDQPVFNENLGNLAESLNKSYTQTAPLFSALGAGRELTKLLPNSVYANDVTKAIIEDPTQTNVDDIKQKIAQHGSEQGWSPEELKATNEHIDKIANATASLPSDIKDKPKAVGLVLDRNTLQAELDQSAGERAKLDPAVADIPSAKEQYLTDKIAQANDKLRSLVTGNRTTYSKGVAEEQGKFFKTTGGEKEEIEPSRYDLESNEREAKKQTNEQVYINETGNVAAPVDLKETEIKNQIKSIDSMVNSITDHQPKNSTEIAENETILKSLKKHRDILTSQLKEPSNEQKNESVPTAEEVQPKPVENEQPSAEAPVENAVTPDQPVEKNNNKFNDFADRVGATETDVDGKTRITPEGSNVHLELVPDPKDPNAVHIGMIRTSADMFKKGLASKKMDEITKLADEQKMPIHLSVANEGENVGWLKSFYKKYGFVEQEHPNENLRDEMQYMYREPKPTGKAEIKAGDPLRVFADKVRQGKINKLGGFKASTGFDSVWDGSLEVVAKTIEGGAKIADAIEAGLAHVKQTDWYKNLTNKNEFDDQYREHLTNEYKQAETEPKPEDKEPIGVTKSETKKQREQRGLEDIPESDRTTLRNMFEEGKDAIQKGDINPRQLATDVVDSPRNLSSTEVNALLADRRSLHDESDQLRDILSKTDTEKDPFTYNDLTNRLNYVEQQLDNNEKALRAGARQNALALVSMQSMINADYSHSSQLARMRAKAGGELTPAMKAEVERYSKELEEAKKQLADYQKAETDRLSKEAVEKEKRIARKNKKTADVKVIRAERKGIVNDFLSELKKLRQSGELNSAARATGKFIAAAAPFMKKMVVNLAKEGIVEFADVVKTIHDEFKDHIEGLTERDVKEALAGNYDERKESKNTLLEQRNAIQRLAKLTNQLEDLQKGVETEKSEKRLVTRRKQIADLEQQIKDLKKQIRVDDLPDRQRERYIKQLHKDISSLDDQIDAGEKKVVSKEDKYASDKEINDLRQQRSDKLEELNQIDPRQKEAAELNAALKATEKSIAEYERRIKENDLHPEKEQKQYNSSELDALREKRDKIKEDYDKLVKEEFTPEERLQQSLQKKLDNLNQRIKDGDFADPVSRPKVETPNAKTIHLQAKVKKAENNFDAMAERLGTHTKSKLEKALDTFRKLRLAFILSGTKVLGKLYGYGAAKRVTNVLDELANTVNSKIPGLKNIVDRSPRYAGGINLKAETKAIAARWNKETRSDVWETLKTGQGDLERIYGKAGIDKDFMHNSGPLDFFQHLHGAIKTPTKRAEFFRSFEHRLNFYEQQGEDVNDPDVQFKAGVGAYVDAKRAILMNDNYLTDKFYKGGLRTLEQSNNTGKTIAAFIRSVFPITKVPTNFVLAAYDRVTGALPPLSRATPLLWKAIAKGAESLTNEEADAVARILSKGQVGLAMMAIAYAAPKGFIQTGGYYMGRRKDGDMKAGDIKIGGVDIPHNLAHNDVIEAMQFMSTIKRAQDYAETNGQQYGILLGIGQGTKGLSEQIPFVDTKKFEEDLTSQKKASATMGTMAKNLLEPRLIQEMAEYGDKPDNQKFLQHPIDYMMSDTKKRDPQSVVDALKTGIPGLREQVQEKQDAATKKLSKIKVKLDDNGVEKEVDFELTPAQIKDREKINEDYIKEHKSDLVEKFTNKAAHDKDYQEKIKKLEKGWTKAEVPAERQKELLKDNLQEYIDKKINTAANKHSNHQIYVKYKGSLKKVEDE